MNYNSNTLYCITKQVLVYILMHSSLFKLIFKWNQIYLILPLVITYSYHDVSDHRSSVKDWTYDLLVRNFPNIRSGHTLVFQWTDVIGPSRCKQDIKDHPSLPFLLPKTKFEKKKHKAKWKIKFTYFVTEQIL